LPPADDEPGVDPVAAARPDPGFSLGQFVRPFRAGLAVGVALVAVDALAGLAGPALVRAGVAGGVARHSTAGLTAATPVSAAGVARVLFGLGWPVALVALAVAPPLVGLTVWFRRASDRAYLRIRDKVALVMASLQESLSGARVVAAFAREGRNLEEFRALSG